MKYLLPLIASVLILGFGTVQASFAVLIDFEDCVDGSSSYAKDGALVTPLGGNSLFCATTPNGSIGAIGDVIPGPPPWVPLRTDLGCITNSVSVEIGDFGGGEFSDDDTVFLEAYNKDDVLIATDSLFTPASLNEMVTLSVSGDRISYIKTGTYDSIHSVFTDNISFECLSIESIHDFITSLNLEIGTENSMLLKLKNAQKSLEQGNTISAINQLTALINYVNAQNGKKIDAINAESIVTQTNALIDSIKT